jgi:N-acetylglutamate synthase-like GNAT family acetyltransferase
MDQEWHRGEFSISTDPRRLDIDRIHEFLSKEAYWALGRSREVVERSILHSLNFGVYRGTEQVGFARVVTDRATFAWLADVFIQPACRKRGLSQWLMTVISGHPELQGLRRWILATRDAHELYGRFGFEPLSAPGRFMQRLNEG